MKFKKILSLTSLLAALSVESFAQTASLNLDIDHAKVKVSPTLYGLMTEEINHSYDGGLYAELIQSILYKYI